MAQQLPPLEIAFRVTGLAEMKAAFKSIQESVLNAEKAMTNATKTAVKDRSNAYADEAKWKARLAKGVGEELAKSLDAETKKEISELKKREAAHKEHARRVGSFLGKSGGGSSGGSSIGGKAGASEAEAGISSAMGAAAIAGLAAAAIAAGAALTQFGGYLINDIIKPSLEIGTISTQLSNQLGGAASGKELHDFIIKQSVASGKSQSDVAATLAKSIENFGDADKAKSATDLALKLGSAYRFNPEQAAGFIQTESQKMPGLDAKQMEAHMATLVGATLKSSSGISAGNLFSLGGKATGAASLFSQDDVRKQMYTSSALVSLLSFAKANGKYSVEEAATHGTQAWSEIKLKGGKKFQDDKGDLINPADIIKELYRTSKGDVGKMVSSGLDPETAQYFGIIMKGLTKGGKDFETSLNALVKTSDVSATSITDLARKVRDEDPGTQLDKMIQELKASLEPVAEVFRKDILPAMKAAMPGFINIIKNDLVPVLEILGKTVGDLILMMLRVMKYVPGSGVEQKDINSFVEHMSGMDPTFARRHYSALDAEGKAIADKQQQEAIAAGNMPVATLTEQKNAKGEVEKITFGVAVDKNAKAMSEHAKLVDELTKSNYALADAMTDTKPGFGVRRVANPIVTGVQ